MTALLTAVEEILHVQARGLTPSLNLRERLELHKSCAEIKKSLGAGRPIEPLAPQESQFWVSKAQSTAAAGSWEALSRRDVRYIGRCLCDGDAPLVDDKDFLKRFLETCGNQISKSVCRILMWVYLYHYRADRAGILQLGVWLADAVMKWDWEWADRQRTLGLFGDVSAPSEITIRIFESEEDVIDQLNSYVEHAAHRTGGMIYAAFSEAVNKFRTSAAIEDPNTVLRMLKRLLEWACLNENDFIYQRYKTEFIEGLLLPWQGSPPPKGIRTKIQSFLIDKFHDPRLGGVDWKGVEEPALRVVRGWLVERALEQFLDVVDELALDHQWKYRRAFWMAYYKKEVISDAWVAFASNGSTKARQIAARNRDNSWLSFAELRGGGDPNHAVLILRIGDTLIVDFSHNGKWRIWSANSRNAPKPYEMSYQREDFSSSTEGKHYNSPNGTWQRTVAGVIAERTGINIPSWQYMP